MNYIITNQTVRAVVAAATIVPILLATFLAFEPTVTTGQETFTVRQQIDQEIAFTVAPQNVTMDQSLQGLTGGTANGSTTFAITTNNTGGYEVRISFASTTAMEHETSGAFIPNLGTSGGTTVADFATSSVSGSSGFAYSITGPHITTPFTGTTAGCGSGSGTGDADACWYLESDATAAYLLIDSTVASDSSGDPYDIYFRTVVDQNPTPALPQGFYTATTTLTAINT